MPARMAAPHGRAALILGLAMAAGVGLPGPSPRAPRETPSRSDLERAYLEAYGRWPVGLGRKALEAAIEAKKETMNAAR
jgi:hypothetical protein